MNESTILPLQELRRIRQERQAAQERDDAERAGAKAANEIVEQQDSIDWDSFWAMLDKRVWTAIDMAAAERAETTPRSGHGGWTRTRQFGPLAPVQEGSCGRAV
jgi:hypothetical protein